MVQIEVPMLRASAAYATRLIEASRRFGDMKYQFHRRVNWTQRHGDNFHNLETNLFQSNPNAYIAGTLDTAPQTEDVFVQKLHLRQVATVVMKVAAHWLFQVLGSFANSGLRSSSVTVYRKAYVDDIELVFEPDEPGVLRAVYPFPLNVGRQLRYLRFLRYKGYRFKLAGNPYSARDLANFLLQRDVRSLQRLESRAQVRHAYQVTALGIQTIQLSDEFDIGSLDFARTLARFPVRVINSAHGVGKYFPIHAYQEFHVITERQAQYYHAVRPCRYTLRTLNDRHVKDNIPASEGSLVESQGIQFVFLSQVFAGITEVVANNEAIALGRLSTAFAESSGISLLYRPHPNNQQPAVPKGFKLLHSLDQVNGYAGTVFASFYSTCQIDPAFKGRKVLLRANLIYPEIVFDDAETILDLEELVKMLQVNPSN